MKYLSMALVLFGVLTTNSFAGGGSWMQQVSGVGRSGDRQTAEKYARQNLKQELESLVERCQQMHGRAKPEEYSQSSCQQYPLNWQCTAGGRVTCYFP